MFPNIEGSSEDSATCTPLFMSTGKGCDGIELVSRFSGSQLSVSATRIRADVPGSHSCLPGFQYMHTAPVQTEPTRLGRPPL